MPADIRIAYDTIHQTLARILEHHGMNGDRAALCATLFANASRDGVPSHGLNRFGRMVGWISAGTMLANAPLERVAQAGALERWDGNFGPGPWNAWQSMARAVELAKQSGIGCVALRHTNHWMRAGNYGWQAADAGCLGICWTNTLALMPAWGGGAESLKRRRLGNTPLVMAVPRENGEHIVLDMAMTQYSWGKLALFQTAGQQSPLAAGFDRAGTKTHDPAAVLNGGSGMPIGHWKGAGLAILLDLFAAVLAGGNATHDIRSENNERGVSQFFLAADPRLLGGAMVPIVEGVIADVTADGAGYPGQRSLAARRESQAKGVAVDAGIWEGILGLEKV